MAEPQSPALPRPALATVLRPADVVLVVPPFAWIDRPSLGLHLLQATARRLGFEVQVLYANLLFCSYFGESTHNTLCRIGHGLFLAERMFARAAYDTPPLGRDGGEGMRPRLADLTEKYARANLAVSLGVPQFLALEAQMADFIEALAQALAGYACVGCTSSFEQNAAAIALLRRIKALSPKTTTLLGGANCEGEMAEGILSLSDAVDHVFSGESEASFAAFLQTKGQERPRIYLGKPVQALDELPTPDYSDYYAQLAAFLPGSLLQRNGLVCLTYETSRGCWWGEKSHCTFCGLNGEGMGFRAKSAERVLAELHQLLPAHPIADPSGVQVAAGGTLQGERSRRVRLVSMTDNIMPHSYFQTLLPRLTREFADVTIMYEEKANLSLQQCQALVQAGIREIQPGIEALSTDLLRLMRKGCTASQNLALLRYARVTGLYLYWNLLYGFPGESLQSYRETLSLMPRLVHLQPPVTACPVVFDRFSPYFDRPQDFGIEDLRPLPYYAEVLPAQAAIARVAYHFEGRCRTALTEDPTLPIELGRALSHWRHRYYQKPAPELSLRRLSAGEFELVDTRGLPGLKERTTLDARQAQIVLWAHPLGQVSAEELSWAQEGQAALPLDGKLVPLATADRELMLELQPSAAPRTEPVETRSPDSTNRPQRRGLHPLPVLP